LIAVSTLDGLAYRSIQEYPDKDFIHLPMIDARRMEVYVAAYTSAFERALEPQPLILSADSFAQWDQYHGIVLSGNGSTKVEKIEELPSSIIYANDKSDAGDIGKVAFQKLRAGEFADLAYIEPEYIKPPNVTRPKKSLL
jgi:tRNA threonylcarbamoyladenosine biosynthesis protein TsaB